jgi:hypothetical protein
LLAVSCRCNVSIMIPSDSGQARRMSHRMGAVILAMALAAPTSAVWAASPQQHAAGNAANALRNSEEPPPAQLGPLSTAEKQGYGCMMAGGASLVLTAMTGTGEVVALFTGATTLPAMDAFGLGLAITGTVFASTCAVGALIAPTAVRLWRYYTMTAR